jgi:hypothetical protein
MQTRASESDIPEQIANKARPAEVAAEAPRRPLGTAEAPVEVRAGVAEPSKVNAQVSAWAEPPPERRCAETTEVRTEVRGRYAGPAEPAAELGTGSAGATERSAYVACRCTSAAEASGNATIGSTRSSEATAQLGG